MALLLIGCQSTDLASFTAGDAAIKVSLPKICEGFLAPVPVPAVTRKTDARLAFAKTADALDEANARLSIGGDCARDERTLFSNMKPATKP